MVKIAINSSALASRYHTLSSQGSTNSGLRNGLSHPNSKVNVATAKEIQQVYSEINGLFHALGQLMQHDAKVISKVAHNMEAYDKHMGG